jgi:hypothetical protein
MQGIVHPCTTHLIEASAGGFSDRACCEHLVSCVPSMALIVCALPHLLLCVPCMLHVCGVDHLKHRSEASVIDCDLNMVPFPCTRALTPPPSSACLPTYVRTRRTTTTGKVLEVAQVRVSPCARGRTRAIASASLTVHMQMQMRYMASNTTQPCQHRLGPRTHALCPLPM